MKTAIATLGDKEDSEISSMAGRAPFYLLFEGKKLVETINNPFRFGAGGAGVSVAKMLVDKGVNLVVAGKFGPNMLAILEERKLKYKEASGKAIDALE